MEFEVKQDDYSQDDNIADRHPSQPANQCDLRQYFSRLNIDVKQHVDAPTHIAFQQNGQQFLKHNSVNLANYLKNNHQINYDILNFREKLDISILYHTNNYQIIKLGVQYGYFSMNLNIINVDAKSQSNNLQFVKSGGFGEVCKIWLEEKPIAVKRIRIFENRLKQTLYEVIKEYFFLVIASALNCGPKISKIYGFDLVLFRNYIEFSMEFCITDQHQSLKMQELKEKLFLMHRLHLIHCDIKPGNIAYCPSYKSFVFLDFGLSLFAKETIGQKTSTSFVGSIQFCSKQMWDLFMNNNSQAVDLYLNDVICLEKSVKFMNQEPAIHQSSHLQEDQASHSVLKDVFAFFQIQAIIMIKSILFHKTMNPANQVVNLSKYKDYFHQYKSKIIDFIKLLPLDKQQINFYTKYFHFGQEDCVYNQANKGNVRYIKHSPVELDYSCEAFVARFHLLNALNSSKVGFYTIQMMKDKNSRNSIFSNPEGLLSSYVLTIVQIIKINGQTDNFDDKIVACKDFLNVFLIDFQQLKDVQIYKRVMSHIFNLCIADFTPQNQQIFTNIVQTIIILQIVREQQLSASFRMVLDSQRPFVKKITVIMQFISSLEFIKEKYVTKYDYDHLMESSMLQLDDFLDNLFKKQELTQMQKLCSYRLKQMIDQKIGYLRQINYRSKLNLYLPVLNSLRILNGPQLLLHDIETYLGYCQAKYQFNRIFQISDKSYNYLSNQIQLRFNHLNHFSYIHFAYLINNYQYNKDCQIMQAYGLFQLQMGKFEQIAHFKIYFLQKIKKLKDIVYSKRTDQYCWDNRPNKDEFISGLLQILQILQKIIDSTNERYYYIDQIQQLLSAIEDYQAVKNFFRQFCNKNIQKLLKLSRKYHKDSDYHHDSFLKLQLTTIRNFITAYNSLNKKSNKDLLAVFVNEAFDVIQNSKCFLCKASCLLQIKQIQAFEEIREDPNQQLAIFADLLAFYLKHSGQISDVERTIVNMIRYWRKSFRLVNTYNLNDFIYQFSKQQNSICICLANIKEYNIFFWLYVYFSQYRTIEQLTNLVFDIVLQLQSKKAINLITTFYNNMIAIIRMSDKSFFEEIKNYHNLVVNCILENRLEKQCPYMAIYFSAILQIKCKGKLDHMIMKVIRQGLSKVDNFTKKILLNLYYQQYAFYYPVSKKKRKILMIKHLKHCFQKVLLSNIISKKLKVKQKSTTFEQKIIYLKKSIAKYHQNIQNVKTKSSKTKNDKI